MKRKRERGGGGGGGDEKKREEKVPQVIEDFFLPPHNPLTQPCLIFQRSVLSCAFFLFFTRPPTPSPDPLSHPDPSDERRCSFHLIDS